jgi:Cdc6-like AAA superfamily ATPase
MNIIAQKLRVFKKPDEVFTPRAPTVNNNMYVRRQSLEERLKIALKSNKYIVIHGESGNGKTWLYKKVFAEEGVFFEVVNLANALAANSLNSAFEQKLGDLKHNWQSAYEATTSGGVRPHGIGVDHSVKKTHVTSAKSPFHSLVDMVHERAGSKPAIIVLDNFEQIIDHEKIRREIASLIISADEDAVANKQVKLAIVGVPGES